VTNPPRFEDIAEPKPTQAGLAETYATIGATLGRGDRAAALKAWDELAAVRNLVSPGASAFCSGHTPTRRHGRIAITLTLCRLKRPIWRSVKATPVADRDRAGLSALVASMPCACGTPT